MHRCLKYPHDISFQTGKDTSWDVNGIGEVAGEDQLKTDQLFPICHSAILNSCPRNSFFVGSQVLYFTVCAIFWMGKFLEGARENIVQVQSFSSSTF